jgi:hypothetical protein
MQHDMIQDLPADEKLVRRADLGLSTPWQEPQSETEKRLVEIWR